MRARGKAAHGGIYTRSTDLEVGEAGAEAIIPLTNATRAAELLAASGLDRLVLRSIPSIDLGRLMVVAQQDSMRTLTAALRAEQPLQRAGAPARATSAAQPQGERELTIVNNLHLPTGDPYAAAQATVNAVARSLR